MITLIKILNIAYFLKNQYLNLWYFLTILPYRRLEEVVNNVLGNYQNILTSGITAKIRRLFFMLKVANRQMTYLMVLETNFNP